MALVIALIIFISLVLMSKGHYHWQYLRQVDIRYQSYLSMMTIIKASTTPTNVV